MKPLVSVIIPVFNSIRYIDHALQSALAQTYPNVEIIAIDDGSTDGSFEVLRAYSGRIKILSQINQGQSVARNNAVNESSGDLIAFLDSDDVWDAQKLAVHVEAMMANGNIIVSYSDLCYIDANGEVIANRKTQPMPSPDAAVFDLIAHGALVTMPPSTTVVCRRAFDAVGGFPIGIRQMEDYSLWLALSLHGPFFHIKTPLTYYRRHSESISVAPDADFGRLVGQYEALCRVKEMVRSKGDSRLVKFHSKSLYKVAMNKAWFERKMGLNDEAVSSYKTAIQVCPTSLDAWGRLGFSHVFKRQGR